MNVYLFFSFTLLILDPFKHTMAFVSLRKRLSAD